MIFAIKAFEIKLFQCEDIRVTSDDFVLDDVKHGIKCWSWIIETSDFHHFWSRMSCFSKWRQNLLPFEVWIICFDTCCCFKYSFEWNCICFSDSTIKMCDNCRHCWSCLKRMLIFSGPQFCWGTSIMTQRLSNVSNLTYTRQSSGAVQNVPSRTHREELSESVEVSVHCQWTSNRYGWCLTFVY